MNQIKSSIYFDNNATTKLSPEVKRYLRKVMKKQLGNPSSPHSYADFSRSVLDDTRSIVKAFLNAADANVYFTSGATEANSLVLQSLLKHKGKKLLVTTSTEHASVSRNAEFLETTDVDVCYLDVDLDGKIKKEEFSNLLKQDGKKLVSIVWANSETGVLQDILELAKIAKNHGAFFHVDASQSIGRIPIDLSQSSIDFLTFTGHKLHAPKGIGCLVSRNKNFLFPLSLGGEQEDHLRPGTENIIFIGALGKALENRMNKFEQITSKLKLLRDTFEHTISMSLTDFLINGKNAERVPNTSNILFKGLLPQTLMARLDNRNLYCSQTSACTSMIPEPSKTLRAMGLSSDDAFSSYRFSFSQFNTVREVKKAVKIIKKEVKILRENTLWREV